MSAPRNSSPNIVSSATTRIRRKAASTSTALSWKPTDPETFDQWVKVFDKVDKQKMPPPQKKRPDPAVAAEFLKALRRRAAHRQPGQTADRGTRGSPPPQSCRVREHAARPAGDRRAAATLIFPKTPSVDGFDNVALGLRLSMLHMEQYLEAADAAISAAMDLGRRPAGHEEATAIPRRRERAGRRQEEGKEDLSRVARRGRHLRRQFAHRAPPVDRARLEDDTGFEFPLARTRPPDGRSGSSFTPRTSRLSDCSPTSTCRPTSRA